jgi:NAD(P)-dependent dehydrogenase (short-subunit alcohol dehydrogenase family)
MPCHSARMKDTSAHESGGPDGLAVVIGGTGGLGAALVHELQTSGDLAQVLALGRSTQPAVDYADEATLAQTAQQVAALCQAQGLQLRLLLVASGYLHGALPGGGDGQPERSWAQLDAAYLQHVMLVNAIGPALVIKHLFPLLAKQGGCKAAFISARVGSIGDNALGGWYGYRASKAALNQLVHTAAIELARRNRQALCVALHPGTVDTGLSKPFAKTGLTVRSASQAAQELLLVLKNAPVVKTGGFYDHLSKPVPW